LRSCGVTRRRIVIGQGSDLNSRVGDDVNKLDRV
jgi:hypothetical protein